MTQTTQAQIDSGESNLDQVPPGSILPGLFEACIMMGYRLLSILAFLAGAVILGCLVAWVLAGGPHMPAAYAGIARTQGIALGMVGYAAVWTGRWWGVADGLDRMNRFEKAWRERSHE